MYKRQEESKDADGEPIEEDDADMPALRPELRLASKRKSEVWNPLLRSKGFLWLGACTV